MKALTRNAVCTPAVTPVTAINLVKYTQVYTYLMSSASLLQGVIYVHVTKYQCEGDCPPQPGAVLLQLVLLPH
jgi:hypothetical protein